MTKEKCLKSKMPKCLNKIISKFAYQDTRRSGLDLEFLDLGFEYCLGFGIWDLGF